MSDASRDSDTPRVVAKTDTRPNREALVPGFVEALRSPASGKSDRDEAIEELTLFACARLTALAEYIDLTATSGKSVLDKRSIRVKKAIEAAVFLNQPPPGDVRDFYRRAAAAIRNCLIARLDALTASRETQDEIPTEPRLQLWRDFHRQAANLPEHLQDVHDLMYYFRLTAQQAAAVLGKRVDAVELDKDVAVYMLRPAFDKARGKS